MNGMIYQANELIEKIKSAREFDGIHSSSIYYLVIEKLNPKLQGSKTYDTEFGRIKITKEEIMEKLEISQAHIWQWMDRANEQLKHLLNEKATIVTLEGETIYNWLSHYTRNEEGFVIQINPFLMPYLLMLDNKVYTKITQDLLLKMKTEYARNLIEIICLFPQTDTSGKMTRTGCVSKYIDKSVIGKFLGAPDYNRWSDFKKNVIDRAVADINSHYEETGFKVFPPQYKKSGRRVVGVEFIAQVPESVWKKNNKIVHQKSDEIQKNKRVAFYLKSHNITSMLDHTEETIAGRDLFALGVDMPMCDNLVKKHGVIVVNRNIEMLRKRGGIIKPAVLVKAIQEDYAGQNKIRDLLSLI